MKRQRTGSVAAHCRQEDLVVQAAVAASNIGAAAGGPNHTVHKGGPIDTVHGDWHVTEAYPPTATSAARMSFAASTTARHGEASMAPARRAFPTSLPTRSSSIRTIGSGCISAPISV